MGRLGKVLHGDVQKAQAGRKPQIEILHGPGEVFFLVERRHAQAVADAEQAVRRPAPQVLEIRGRVQPGGHGRQVVQVQAVGGRHGPAQARAEARAEGIKPQVHRVVHGPVQQPDQQGAVPGRPPGRIDHVLQDGHRIAARVRLKPQRPVRGMGHELVPRGLHVDVGEGGPVEQATQAPLRKKDGVEMRGQ
jgi:hypothetical protein